MVYSQPLPVTTHMARNRVSFNRKSVALSAVFLVNLVLMPLKPYFFEASPFNSIEYYRPPDLFGPLPQLLNRTATTNASKFTAHLQDVVGLSSSAWPLDSSTYWVDLRHLVDAACTPVVHNCSLAPPSSRAVVGAVYFPPDVKLTWIERALCTEEPMAYSWAMTTMTLPSSTSLIWTVPSQNADVQGTITTVCYAYVVEIRPLWLRLLKLLARVLLCLWIARVALFAYYTHVLHLYKQLQQLPLHSQTTAVRYELVIGEPTCVILSHPWTGWLFVLDIWMSAEYVGLACLRVSQTSNVLSFLSGMLYLSRTVWCSYTALTALNAVVSKFPHLISKLPPPVNTTILAMMAMVAGGGVVVLQEHFVAIVDWYTTVLSVVHTCDADHRVQSLDSSLTMLVYLLSMAPLPVLLPVLKRLFMPLWVQARSVISHVRVSSVASMLVSSRPLSKHRLGPSIPPVYVEPPRHSKESQVTYNDFKHRIVLWLCQLSDVPPAKFTGGSVYPLFRKCPEFQTQCTISQRGADCYVMTYGRDDALLEVTRVTLASQVAVGAPRLGQASSSPSLMIPLDASKKVDNAVGRFVVKHDNQGLPSIKLYRGVSNSPWLA